MCLIMATILQSVIGGRNDRYKTRNDPNLDDNIRYTMTSKTKGLEELQDHSKKKMGKAFFHDRAKGGHGSSLTLTSLANKNATFVTECL